MRERRRNSAIYHLAIITFTFVFLVQSIVCAAPQAAQEKPQEEKEETAIQIGTDLIQIDVVVTDKNGRAVENLTQDDFELLEEGKPQQIAFFSVIKGRLPEVQKGVINAEVTAPKAQQPAQEEPTSQVYVLFIDDLHISAVNMINVKKVLKSFVNEKLREGDRVAVVSTGGGLGFLQQLTSDRRVYTKAIDRLSSRVRPAVAPGDPTAMTDYQAQKINENDMASLDLAVENYYRNTQTTAPREAVEEIVRTTARSAVQFLVTTTSATLSTLRSAMLSLKDVPGRKNLMLVSDGFLLDDREANHNNEMRRVVDAATRAGVVVYSLSSAGLVAFNPIGDITDTNSAPDTTGTRTRIDTEGQGVSNFGLSQIASQTGGLTILNNNNLRVGLDRMLADNQCYYVLAYYPEKERQDGKFHKISVRVKNNDKLSVRTRQGFIAGEDRLADKVAKESKESKDKNKKKEPASPHAEHLRKVLFSVADVEKIRVKMAAGFLAAGNEANNSIVSLAINLGSVEFQKVEGKYKNALTSVLLVVSEEGKVLNALEDTLNLNFTEENFSRAAKGWFFFGKNLSLKPGFYNLRFAVYDPVTKVAGSASQWVEIPDLTKAQIAMSEIVLLSEQTTDNGSKQALRQFNEKESLGYLAYLYNSSGQNIEQRIQFVRGNEVVFVSPWLKVKPQPDKFNRIVCGAKIPLAGLKEGNYVLKVEVKDGNKEVMQTQSFSIVK